MLLLKAYNVEEKISIKSDGLQLQGLLHRAEVNGVVVTHPHPRYGGDMYNPVVETITRTFQHQGYTTLRFDFRGVGNSQGRYDKGSGEKRDVCRALDYLARIPMDKICLAGYSFGAWVNAQIYPGDPAVTEMIMVSPPVAFIDFGSISDLGALRLIVTGSRDDIAPPDLIEKSYAGWNAEAQFEVINGADHFYAGYLDKLGAILAVYLEDRE